MLTPLQIGRLNSMCSQGGLPSLTKTGMYTWEMTSPVLLLYATIGVTSNPCKVLLPICTSATIRVRLIIRCTVTTFPSFGRVFARHVTCTGAAFCDDVLIIASLAEGLALGAELKQVLKQDLDLDLDVLKFNCFFLGD